MMVEGGEVSSSSSLDVYSTSDDQGMVSRVLQGKRRRGTEQGWVEDVGRATKQNTVDAGGGAVCLHSSSFGAFLAIPKFSQRATDMREKVGKGVIRV